MITLIIIIAEIDTDVIMDIDLTLEGNLRNIIQKYAFYVDCVRKNIEDIGVTPEGLRGFLLSLPAFGPTKKGIFLLSDIKKDLKRTETITEIFNLLITESASFLNYDIFESILRRYNIPKDESLQYSEHLNDYVKRHKVSEFLRINPNLKSESRVFEKFILKFDIETTCRLAKVLDLKRAIARILGLRPSALKIIDVKEGCIIVTFHIPTSVANALFTANTVFTKQQQDELRAISLLWLKCNGYTYFRKESFQVEIHTKSSGN